MTDSKVLEWWRVRIAEALKGNDEAFLLAFREPSTREFKDANGNWIIENTWRDVPGEIREEILDLFENRPRNRKRGAKNALDALTQLLLRHQHQMNVAQEHVFATRDRGVRVVANETHMTPAASVRNLAKEFKVSLATMERVLGLRKKRPRNKRVTTK